MDLQEGISEGGWREGCVIWHRFRTGQWGKGSLMPLEWEPQPDPPPSFLADMCREEEKGQEEARLRDAPLRLLS